VYLGEYVHNHKIYNKNTCDYFSVVTCGFCVASVWLPGNLVDGDAIS
jgi:hypothetical protein